MPRKRPPLSFLAVLACLVAACTARAPGELTPGASPGIHPDHNLLTEQQLREHHFVTAYEAVAALRSSWLETRGPDSFTSPSQVLVYLDESRLGSVETLRALPMTNVLSIRYIDGIAASARWGLDHGQGVILVSTRM